MSSSALHWRSQIFLRVARQESWESLIQLKLWRHNWRRNVEIFFCYWTNWFRSIPMWPIEGLLSKNNFQLPSGALKKFPLSLESLLTLVLCLERPKGRHFELAFRSISDFVGPFFKICFSLIFSEFLIEFLIWDVRWFQKSKSDSYFGSLLNFLWSIQYFSKRRPLKNAIFKRALITHVEKPLKNICKWQAKMHFKCKQSIEAI